MLSNNLQQSPYHILRIGLAVTFLWIGILIFRNPEAWGGYLQPWAAKLMPIPLAQTMIGVATLDITIGFLLLIDVLTWFASAIGAAHLVIVLIVSGINAITVRDIGLLSSALALAIFAYQKRSTNFK